MVPLKRRKLLSTQTGNNGNTGTDVIAVKAPVKFPDVVLFLLERKMGASRRAFLSQLAAKNEFRVEETFSAMVTHVISEGNSGAEVGSWLDSQTDGSTHRPVNLLDISWFTQSMKAGRPIDIQHTHRLQEQQVDESEVEVFSVPSFACQRRTTLENHNTVLTDALSLLAEMAELSGEEGRGVAFRRASAVLKCLNEPVTTMSQLRGLPCLGEHSLRVIQDILVNGASSEAESTKCSERFKALKLLTGIFGVGCKTADRWIREGILSLQQLTDSAHSLNRAQQAGVDLYDDLNQSVTKAEADSIAVIVEKALVTVLPGATMTLIGGFRRGKQTGHDVDFLITHPEEGAEVGLMPKVVSWLQSKGFILYQKTTRNSYLESKDGPARPASNMDRFERCFSIFKLDKQGPGLQSHTLRATDGEGSHFGSAVDSVCEPENGQIKPWRAVRVDLVVSPISQFPFALLGWTGSKLFERELRRWAGQEKSMSLSSHALYDSTQRKYLRATSEEEIFTHLGLEFIPPSERNA